MLAYIRWNSVERPSPPVFEAFPYGEIRIGVDASYPPFGAATASDLFGIDIDLGKAIGEEIGLPVRFVNMGFDGLYDSIVADQVDLLVSALIIDPSKLDNVRYTGSYFNGGLVLVSPITGDIHDMEDVAGRKLAYEFGSNADAEARQWLRRVHEFEMRPFEIAEYALDDVFIHHTADAALVDAISLGVYLHEHPELKAQHTYVTDQEFAIAVRFDREETWKLTNKALQAIKDNGILEQIMEKWL